MPSRAHFGALLISLHAKSFGKLIVNGKSVRGRPLSSLDFRSLEVYLAIYMSSLDMDILPLPGIPGSDLLIGLKEVLTELRSKTIGVPQVQHYEIYFYWTNYANIRLENLLHRRDIDRLISTPRHWAMAGMGPHMSGNVSELVRIEISQRISDFEKLIRSLEEKLSYWNYKQGQLVIPDTNIYLHSVLLFDEMDWSKILQARLNDIHLVIPLLIIDELDNQKRSNAKTDNEKFAVRTRARMTLKKISEIFFKPTLVHTLHFNDSNSGKVFVSLFMDNLAHERLIDNDSEIIDRACSLRDLTNREVTIVTFDVSMSLRAKNAGLNCVLLENEKQKQAD